jgi:TPR repeat protein
VLFFDTLVIFTCTLVFIDTDQLERNISSYGYSCIVFTGNKVFVMTHKLIALVLALSATTLFAQTATQAQPQDCNAEAHKTVQVLAETGDKRAQFMLGSQQMLGKCAAYGEKNTKLGFANVSKSAAQNYAPAMYLVGVAYLRQGIDQPALAMLFGAAKRGFREAEVMLGIMFANDKFSKKDNDSAYGWLSLALHHATVPKQQKALEDKLAEVRARMSLDELAKADETKAKFLKEMGNIPVFSDAP